MRTITAPDTMVTGTKTVFAAGGITGCPDWQAKMLTLLHGTNLVVFNPRRKDFDVKDPKASEKQIQWEFERLRQADGIFFWFPKETLCPIVLYELGAWSMTKKPIFVGCHPEYQRKQDVIIQTHLARPEVRVVFTLDGLAEQVRAWSEVP